MKVFLLGYPGEMGGANTEAWHTIKLWRQFGVDVHLIPTWGTDTKWENITNEIGCVTHHVDQSSLQKIDGLKGGTVVSFCNDMFLYAVDALRNLDCKLIWVNCMTYVNPLEMNVIRDVGPFNAMVYQSEFQRGLIEGSLASTSYNPATGHLIRGAFDLTGISLSIRPHEKNSPFVVGRAARPAPSKWSSNTWPIYRRIQYPSVEAVMLGMDDQIHKKLGTPPDWATCLRPMAIPADDFYKMLHCLMPINGGDRENWPRVGLEAFASGVPVVAQNEWGWKEMIIHGETGFLGYQDCELAHWTATMAYDEGLREKIATNAWTRLQDELANPEVLFNAWEKVFQAAQKASSKKSKVPSRQGKACPIPSGRRNKK